MWKINNMLRKIFDVLIELWKYRMLIVKFSDLFNYIYEVNYFIILVYYIDLCMYILFGFLIVF